MDKEGDIKWCEERIVFCAKMHMAEIEHLEAIKKAYHADRNETKKRMKNYRDSLYYATKKLEHLKTNINF